MALAGIGLAAGTINTVAGGGSFLTLPALIFLGLPPTEANATNRVSVFFQSTSASVRFVRGKAVVPRVMLPRMLVAGTAAALGAMGSLQLHEHLFRQIVGVAILGLLALMLLRPTRWLHGGRRPAPRVVELAGFFAAGLYGGFLQAGVGLFLLAVGVLLAGEDLVRANAGKNLLVAAFTAPALGVFAWNGAINLPMGLALSVGSIVGGWLGAQLALRLGASFLRLVLVVVAGLSATRLLGLW